MSTPPEDLHAEGLVSVIIPTIGRPELRRAIASVRLQAVPVEIVVVNDSGSRLELADGGADVRVVDTSGHTGASSARNLGMREARGDFLAFLDDDDVWLDGHLRDALRVLRERPDVDIYCSRGLVRYAGQETRIEPLDSLGDDTVHHYTFGVGAFVRRGRRVLTPTLVFRRVLATHLFDVSLPAWEDTWWLLTAEKAGHRVLQSENVGILVDASRDRNVGRLNDELLLTYCHRVETIQPGTGVRQLLALARWAAWAGRPRTVLRLGGLARTMPEHRAALPWFAVAAAAGTARAGLGRVLGR